MGQESRNIKANNTNIVGLGGTVAIVPKPYRNVYGQKNVYVLYMDVARDSGTIDRIMVLFQEDKIARESFQEWTGEDLEVGGLAELIKEGSRLEVTGNIQTCLKTEQDAPGGRTQLFVWAQYLAEIPADSQEMNVVYIKGEIAKVPNYRETPRGKRITDIVVRIPSIFAEGFYSYVPCIAWWKKADHAALMQEGDTVYIEGRLQSREYTKKTKDGEQDLTTWEVSVCKMEP